MFGQAGPIQIDRSATPGDGIVTPGPSYTTIFWATVAPGVLGLFCKESDGATHTVTAGGNQVVCQEEIPA